MQSLGGAASRRLVWSQDSTWTRRFTLSADGQPAGTLEFNGHFGTLATARTGDGCWTFKRVGFWQATRPVPREEARDEFRAVGGELEEGFVHQLQLQVASANVDDERHARPHRGDIGEVLLRADAQVHASRRCSGCECRHQSREGGSSTATDPAPRATCIASKSAAVSDARWRRGR